MTDSLIALVPQHGTWLLAVAAFLSCLALPVPTSLMMLTAGGFAASGDLVAWQIAAGAFGGAVLGDQAGFHLGRAGGVPLLARVMRNPKRARLVAKANAQMHRNDWLGVFLTRWLFSPVGPYVNFAGGAAGLNWARFSFAAIAGETVWVGLYVGLGYGFADRIVDLAALLGNASGFLAALLVTVLLGLWLRARIVHDPVDAPR